MTTLSNIKAALLYDPETGRFTWLPRTVGKPRGTPWAGKEAGSIWRANKNVSYVVISLFGVKYFAHRLAFFYMTGRWPHPCVDHIDGDGLNNAWLNLREATKSLNSLNTSRRGKAGQPIGVQFDQRRGKFSSRLRRDGVTRWLGYHETEAAAVAARDAALAAYQGVTDETASDGGYEGEAVVSSNGRPSIPMGGAAK